MERTPWRGHLGGYTMEGTPIDEMTLWDNMEGTPWRGHHGGYTLKQTPWREHHGGETLEEHH